MKRTLKHYSSVYDTQLYVNKHIDSMYLYYVEQFQIVNCKFPVPSTFSICLFKLLSLNLFNILI